MSAFDALPSDHWPDIAAGLALPWHSHAAAHDLRWYAARHATLGAKLPAVRELADRWGWSRTRVHELLTDAARWRDHARPWGWRTSADKKRTSGGQAADTSDGETPAIDEKADSRRTAGGQEADSRAILTGSPDHPCTEEGRDHARDDVPQAEEALDLPALLDGNHQLVAPLVAAGIATVDALAALTAREVQLRPGIGPKRLQAIAAALQRHGLSFAPDATSAARTPAPRPGLRRLTDGWCEAVQNVTGQAYRWTPTGPNSDQRAAATLYDAVGWGEDPSAEVRADIRGTIGRYLRHCRETGWVPTLPDLVRQLPRWRQEPGVSQRRELERRTPTQARHDNRRDALALLDHALDNIRLEAI